MTRNLLVLLVAVLSLCCGCASTGNAGSGSASAMVYVCGCGDDCKACDAVALQPGKCGCGKERLAHHLITVVGTDVKICSCDGSCSCAVSKGDPNTCTCGKPIRTVSLAGKGFYTCACSEACCTGLSMAPGKCGCGKDLVPVK